MRATRLVFNPVLGIATAYKPPESPETVTEDGDRLDFGHDGPPPIRMRAEAEKIEIETPETGSLTVDVTDIDGQTVVSVTPQPDGSESEPLPDVDETNP